MRWTLRLFGLSLLLLTASLGQWRHDDSPPLGVVFVSAREGNARHSDIYRIHPDGSSYVNLTHTPNEDESLISVAPNGQWFLAGTATGYVIVKFGSPTTRLYLTTLIGDARAVFPMIWSPDSRYLSFAWEKNPGSNSWQLGIVDVENQTAERLSIALSPDCPNAEYTTSEYNPHWSPDGEWLYFEAIPCQSHEPSLYRMRPDGSDRQLILENIVLPYWYFWSADGKWLYFQWLFLQKGADAPRQLYRLSPAEHTLEVVTEVSHPMTWLESTPEWLYFSMDGRRLPLPQLYRMRWDGSEYQTLTTLADGVYFQTLARDHQWLYFSTYMKPILSYRMRVDGSQLAPLVEGLYITETSLDGTWLYALDESFKVWIVRSDGKIKHPLNLRKGDDSWAIMPLAPQTPSSTLFGIVGLLAVGLSFLRWRR